MIIAVVKSVWVELRQKMINRQREHWSVQLANADRAQEKSISILQNRYGYTKEQAKSELSKHYSKALLY